MELCRKDAGNYGILFVDKRLSKAKSTTSLQLVFSLTTFTKEKKVMEFIDIQLPHRDSIY